MTKTLHSISLIPGGYSSSRVNIGILIKNDSRLSKTIDNNRICLINNLIEYGNGNNIYFEYTKPNKFYEIVVSFFIDEKEAISVLTLMNSSFSQICYVTNLMQDNNCAEVEKYSNYEKRVFSTTIKDTLKHDRITNIGYCINFYDILRISEKRKITSNNIELLVNYETREVFLTNKKNGEKKLIWDVGIDINNIAYYIIGGKTCGIHEEGFRDKILFECIVLIILCSNCIPLIEFDDVFELPRSIQSVLKNDSLNKIQLDQNSEGVTSIHNIIKTAMLAPELYRNSMDFGILQITRKLCTNKDNILTITIPHYNGNKYSKLTVNSCISQNTDFKFSIIVVDNCSTDGSFEEISLINSHNLILRRNRYNIGSHNNWTVCYMLCDSKYFIWLCADDIIKQNHINNSITALEGNKNACLYYTPCELIDENGKFISILNHPGHKLESYCGNRDEFIDLLFFDNYITPSAAVLKTINFTNSENLTHELSGAGDWNLWITASTTNSFFVFSKVPETQYRIHNAQDSTNFFNSTNPLSDNLTIIERIMGNGVINNYENFYKAFSLPIERCTRYRFESISNLANKLSTLLDSFSNALGPNYTFTIGKKLKIINSNLYIIDPQDLNTDILFSVSAFFYLRMKGFKCIIRTNIESKRLFEVLNPYNISSDLIESLWIGSNSPNLQFLSSSETFLIGQHASNDNAIQRLFKPLPKIQFDNILSKLNLRGGYVLFAINVSFIKDNIQINLISSFIEKMKNYEPNFLFILTYNEVNQNFLDLIFKYVKSYHVISMNKLPLRALQSLVLNSTASYSYNCLTTMFFQRFKKINSFETNDLKLTVPAIRGTSGL